MTQRGVQAQPPQPADHGARLPAIAPPEIAQRDDRSTVNAEARRTKGDVGHPDHVLERRRAAPALVRRGHRDDAVERAQDMLGLEPDAAAQQMGDEAVERQRRRRRAGQAVAEAHPRRARRATSSAKAGRVGEGPGQNPGGTNQAPRIPARR
jgi:hypothetical protein